MLTWLIMRYCPKPRRGSFRIYGTFQIVKHLWLQAWRNCTNFSFATDLRFEIPWPFLSTCRVRRPRRACLLIWRKKG